MGFYFHTRIATPTCPAGTTVSRNREMPEGDFMITEYSWPDGTVLWFIEDDNFAEDERRLAYTAFKSMEQEEAI